MSSAPLHPTDALFALMRERCVTNPVSVPHLLPETEHRLRDTIDSRGHKYAQQLLNEYTEAIALLDRITQTDDPDLVRLYVEEYGTKFPRYHEFNEKYLVPICNRILEERWHLSEHCFGHIQKTVYEAGIRKLSMCYDRLGSSLYSPVSEESYFHCFKHAAEFIACLIDRKNSLQLRKITRENGQIDTAYHFLATHALILLNQTAENYFYERAPYGMDNTELKHFPPKIRTIVFDRLEVLAEAEGEPFTTAIAEKIKALREVTLPETQQYIREARNTKNNQYKREVGILQSQSDGGHMPDTFYPKDFTSRVLQQKGVSLRGWNLN